MREGGREGGREEVREGGREGGRKGGRKVGRKGKERGTSSQPYTIRKLLACNISNLGVLIYENIHTYMHQHSTDFSFLLT